MTRTLALTVASSLLIVAAASADVKKPDKLPDGLQYVEPSMRFEGIEKYADYVFYLRYNTDVGGPTKLENVKESALIELKGTAIRDVSLLAIGRLGFDKRAASDKSLKWLTDKADGVLAVQLDTPATTAPKNAKPPAATVYQVNLQDGKLAVQKAEVKKNDEEAQANLLPTWAFGIVSSLSIAWLGIWFARRRHIQGDKR